MKKQASYLAAGLAAALPFGLPAAELTVGRPFPEIILPSVEDGSARSIAEFRGQKVLLQIFASW